MKRITSSAIAIGFLIGATAGAQSTQPQQKSHTESTTKYSGPGADTKTKTETVVGTVKEYEAGKKIKISGPNDKTYSFDLDKKDQAARVEGSIVVGQMAKIEYRKADDGSEVVSVISEASPASQAAVAAPRVHAESTTKHTGPGPDTKVKSETVVGVVKAYAPGKKLTVTGPSDKDYSFDLDENVAFKGEVGIGQRVKVTYTKNDEGDRLTEVALLKPGA
jgi:hypothetical protein